MPAALIWRKGAGPCPGMSETGARIAGFAGMTGRMTRRDAHPDDPRALIAEAYRIEGLTPQDARSIFFDWALGLPAGTEPGPAAERLIAHHRPPDDHPMTTLLREAAGGSFSPRRRGGVRAGRRV